jgi:hypothetical protein
MKNLILLATGFIVLLVVCCATFQPSSEAAPTAGPARLGTQALASLDAKQRIQASFPFANKERFNWDFVPRETNKVSDRKGVALKHLDPAQRSKFQALLKSALSAKGYERAEQVRLLEGLLLEREGEARRFTRDPEFYFFSFFGLPGEGMWGWRMEGHHLCLNFTYHRDRLISATPLCLGANPARVDEGDKKGLRVLGALEDDARKLVRSLPDAQRRVALGSGKTLEVQARQKRKYDVPLPKGLPASELNDEQKKLLMTVISHYHGNLPSELASHVDDRMKKAGIDKIQITWRGSLEPHEPHSYIFHGPTFVISYVNNQNAALHVHAAMRQLGGDFGQE